ncbi:hypothetical protein M9458_039332, partial [Cirrhinus mrigala]
PPLEHAASNPNSSDHLPSPKQPHVLQSSVGFLNLEPPAAAPHSSLLASNVASHIYIGNLMDMKLPLEFTAPILSPSSSVSPTSSLVPSSPPESPSTLLVLSSAPVPAPPDRPPEPVLLNSSWP